jgi:predicted nucleic acid-binding protein
VTVLVLDASVALAVVLEEAGSDAARNIVRGAAGGIIVPFLWHIEVGNSLILAQRRRQIQPTDRQSHLADLAALRVAVDDAGPAAIWNHTTTLALRHNLTLYDATYLELAVRRNLPLASFDQALIRAAAAEGLPVYR